MKINSLYYQLVVFTLLLYLEVSLSIDIPEHANTYVRIENDFSKPKT